MSILYTFWDYVVLVRTESLNVWGRGVVMNLAAKFRSQESRKAKLHRPLHVLARLCTPRRMAGLGHIETRRIVDTIPGGPLVAIVLPYLFINHSGLKNIYGCAVIAGIAHPSFDFVSAKANVCVDADTHPHMLISTPSYSLSYMYAYIYLCARFT